MTDIITQTATLYCQLASVESLSLGWAKVLENDSAPGIDHVTVAEFGVGVNNRLRELSEQLLSKQYRPKPLLTFERKKANGGIRTLGIATVADRVVQSSALLVLNPIIDKEFSASSYAFRQGISRLDAAHQIDALRDQGYRYVVDADIEQFFDNVDHAILLERCFELLHDRDVVDLLAMWIKADAMTDGGCIHREKGLPQGAVISPLLANLYLDKFDDLLEGKGNKLIRFADDFVILCKTKPQAEMALELSEEILGTLKLKIQSEKTHITSFEDGFRYLGYLFIKSLVLPSKKPSTGERDAMMNLVHAAREIIQKEAAAAPPPPITPAGEGGEKAETEAQPAQAYSPFLRTLYIQEQGATLHRDGERLVVQKGEQELLDIQAIKVEQVFIFGACMITPAALRLTLTRDIPITLLSEHGNYYGRIESTSADHASLQRIQALRSFDEEFILATARAIIRGKIENSIDLLRRQHRKSRRIALSQAIDALIDLLKKMADAGSVESLLGYEGSAAARYFEAFNAMVDNSDFHFDRRSRQPPEDRMNSLLSFLYTLLFYNIYSLVQASGLNPYMGILHREKLNHPALVSDLIEEFRCVVESAAIYLVNNKIIRSHDYLEDRSGQYPFLLAEVAKKKVVGVFEDAMQQSTFHADSGRAMNIRRIIEAQVRILVKVMKSERPVYVPYRRN